MLAPKSRPMMWCAGEESGVTYVHEIQGAGPTGLKHGAKKRRVRTDLYIAALEHTASVSNNFN